jgi:hypothetical protein
MLLLLFIPLDLIQLLQQLPVRDLPIHTRKRVVHVWVGRRVKVRVGRLFAAAPLAAVAVAPAAAAVIIIFRAVTVSGFVTAAALADRPLPATSAVRPAAALPCTSSTSPTAPTIATTGVSLARACSRRSTSRA